MAFFKCYRPHRFTPDAQKTVDQATEIIEDLQSQGYTLNLRQLYYQFVQRNWFPNEHRQYKRLGRIITQAREAGVMDWQAIEDTHRALEEPYTEDSHAGVLEGIDRYLVLNPWLDQDTYLEVWVEKQALEGIVSVPCDARMVPYMSCKGYLSASEAWRAGRRFEEAEARGKHTVILHLADHDPSGLHMTVDNRSRVQLFAQSRGVEVRRIALNMDQVDHYALPPNPAKEKDSRSTGYVEKYGKDSWELDALSPKVLDQLIRTTIDEYIDTDAWQKTRTNQSEARMPLVALSENWKEVFEFLESEGLV